MTVGHPIASPCVKLCRLAPEVPLCIGCFRTLDEIAAWAGFAEAERRAVLAQLEARRLIYEAQEKNRQCALE
jgi:predicted Fe-S protein YdhL (DUF1289 family)